MDIGVHAIDFALSLLEFPPISDISGVTRSLFGSRPDYTYLEMHGTPSDGPFDVDDSATAFIQCANDTTIALDVAWAANRPPETALVIRGEDAGARLDLSDDDLTIFETSSTGTPHFTDTSITTRDDEPHRREQRQFIETIQSGDPLAGATVDQALTVQRVMEAIYRSDDHEATKQRDTSPVPPIK